MVKSLRVEDDSYEVFNQIKKTLEKKAEIKGGIKPRYTQSDIVKLVCKHYIDTVLTEGVDV